jgi:phospholipase C
MDHVVVILFENRSLDNVLGHLYGPEDGKTFEGLIGKDLSNTIPDWAEHGAAEIKIPSGVPLRSLMPQLTGGPTRARVRTPRRRPRLDVARVRWLAQWTGD